MGGKTLLKLISGGKIIRDPKVQKESIVLP